MKARENKLMYKENIQYTVENTKSVIVDTLWKEETVWKITDASMALDGEEDEKWAGHGWM